MNTGICLTVNLAHLVDNYRRFSAAKANSKTVMAAVVKDDAYGLGAKAVAQALYTQANCRTFFVAHAREGHHIRPVVPEANVYVLNGFCARETKYFKESHLIPVLSDLAQKQAWDQVKPHADKVAIQVETGLHRLGFSLAEVQSLAPSEKESVGLVLSHLACADNPDHPLNRQQLDQFRSFLPLFPGAQASLSASDGFLLGSAYQFDIVRLGAVLYGLNPVPGASLHSQPVVRLTAPILQVKPVSAGDSIGYNATSVMPSDGRIAILEIGYGDGLFRSFSPRGKVWFRDGSRLWPAPVLGPVSMDLLIADVSAIPASVLDQAQSAELLNEAYTADDMARDAGTIGYEILSSLGQGHRTTRFYER